MSEKSRLKRAQAITSMQASIDKCGASKMPYWLIATLALPVFLGIISFQFLTMACAVLAVMAKHITFAFVTPIVALWAFLDVFSVTLWCISSIVGKMNGDKQ